MPILKRENMWKLKEESNFTKDEVSITFKRNHDVAMESEEDAVIQ